MTENKKEEIVESLKIFCNKCIEKIDFDEFEIKFQTVAHSVFQDGFRIRNSIQINDEIKLVNKKDRFCYAVSGDADSETIAKYALVGYIKEKKIFLNDKKQIEAEEKYKKDHPILAFFR